MSQLPSIETILSIVTISNILTLFGLFLTIKEMRRNRRLDEENSTDDIYEQNREEKLAMLADKDIAEFIAKEQDMSIKQYKIRIANSIRINQTKRIFRRYQKKQIRSEDWEGYKLETKELFFLPSVEKRWRQIEQVIDTDFRQFINEEVLTEPQPQKLNTNETNSNPNHV